MIILSSFTHSNLYDFHFSDINDGKIFLAELSFDMVHNINNYKCQTIRK